MNLALGMWLLLAGDWVLPATNDPSNLAPLGNSGAYNAIDRTDIGSKAKMSALASGLPTSTQSPASGPGPAQRPSRPQGPSQSQYGRPASYGLSSIPRRMPVAPTDASIGGMPMMPMAPTDPRTAGMQMPMPPTSYGTNFGRTRPGSRVPGYSPGGYSNVSRLQSQMSPSFTRNESQPRGPAQIGTIGSNTGPNTGGFNTSKAFAGYTPPSPVSPYLSIFQNNTAGGTIDPYTTNVKPILDQQQRNMQLSNNISQLQSQVSPLLAPPAAQDQAPPPIPQYDLNGPPADNSQPAATP